MSERKLCLHTALNRTFTISKVNLNLHYFCLIEIWKSEVQGWNLSKIFGILTSGFGHNKITSNEPWNTETHKTDRNPPIRNHNPWRFEPVKIKFCFLRGPFRWLTAAKNAIVSWFLNFRIRMFVKSAIISWVTNYVSDLGFLTCLSWIVSIENSTLSNV